MRLETSWAGPAFEGMSFGEVGPYEKIVGRAFGAVDPRHRLNCEIFHLDKAPRNRDGLVDYWVDFCLLKPADPGKSRRTLLYDAPNRGNKVALVDINDAPKSGLIGANDPSSIADAGNGFLMRHGFAILFCAWQGGLGPEANQLTAGFPIATDNGAPIVQLSREEIVFSHCNSPAVAPLSYAAATLDQAQAVLTVRTQEHDRRVPLPASQWRFVSANQIEIRLAEGFAAGAIYEFIYPAKDPIVMGLGFAAVRDLVAFMRYRAADANGHANPLNQGSGPAVDNAIAYGRSQPGRFLREFVNLGFNETLDGRRVFDGIYTSLAGSRRIFLNQPFSQPGRFNRQHEDHLYPGDQFPFTYATRSDSISGRSGGILARAEASGTAPKIIHADSGTEFWQGRGSLVVCDERGHDIELPENVRVYSFASTQHAGTVMPPEFSLFARNPSNPLSYHPLTRALILALDEWVRGQAPPPSCFSRVADCTLVPPLPRAGQGFPEIPGLAYSGTINELSELDHGQMPPRPIPGHKYVLLVPKVDADGNDLAGIRLPELEAPLGTYTGWNLRDEGFAEGALMLIGSFIPFARTAKERMENRDPRRSLEERYPGHQDYVDAVTRAARHLQKRRFLLEEDVEHYIAAAKTHSFE